MNRGHLYKMTFLPLLIKLREICLAIRIAVDPNWNQFNDDFVINETAPRKMDWEYSIKPFEFGKQLILLRHSWVRIFQT
jgi:hypothetical protein